MSESKSKETIRRKIQALIGSIDLEAESAAIVARLTTILPKQGMILSYLPLKDEPDITPINETLKTEGRLVLIGNDRKTTGFEPPEEPIIMALVPGRAFDTHGVRLGRGGGAYDRILAQLTTRKIGVAFACQFVDALPREPHDVLMDGLVTSAGFQLVALPESTPQS